MIALKKSILKTAINGKNKSIKEIIIKCINFSYSILVIFLENDKLAKENVKNVMDKVYKEISNLKSYKNFYSWFYSLIKKEIENYKINSYYNKSYSRNDFIEVYFKVNKIKYDKNLYNIFNEILNFQEQDKEIFILIEFEGLSCKQVSKLLNIPIEVVRYRLFYCKNILKNCYEKV
jgi:RNA polymerase sigma factor (sigma-70 family)